MPAPKGTETVAELKKQIEVLQEENNRLERQAALRRKHNALEKAHRALTDEKYEAEPGEQSMLRKTEPESGAPPQSSPNRSLSIPRPPNTMAIRYRCYRCGEHLDGQLPCVPTPPKSCDDCLFKDWKRHNEKN
jgi:FtsZ-binding cell division protein ZapB